ncbi:MAG: radical SAM protein [Dehalococcoidales bacterium]|nr:radical SAM protein [Dehalococcoidales bacterium]
MSTVLSIARIKAELQEKGVKIPEGLVEELEAKYNAPALRTGRLVLCLESPAGQGELIPVFIVNGKRGSFSPYALAKDEDGKLEVRKGEELFSRVTFLPKPHFYSRFTSGNTPMSQVAVVVGPGHLRCVASQKCIYQQTGQPCKFCAVQNWWNAIGQQQPEQIAETVETAYREGAARHISMTTASLDTTDRGLAKLVETARLINGRAPVPMMFEFEPLRDHGLLRALLSEARGYGVTTISINVECYNPALREEIMPGKGKIPVEEYIQNWQIGLEVFGGNEVATVVVVGIGEEDDSILKGVEMAASRGVVTFLVPHSPAVGAVYQDMAPPPADRMLRLYDKAAGLYRKYNLDLCACTAGCIQGGGFSAIKEVARFGL